MSYLCGSWLPDLPWPDAGEGACCEGAAFAGARGCTCWTPVHDLPQARPRPGEDAATMPRMCVDCAYRPGSPERRDDPTVVASSRQLDAIVESGQAFWCHNGLRKLTHYVHPPTGTVYVPEGGVEAAYQPPIIGGRPFKADGSPADYCAGWAALLLKRMQRGDLQAPAGGVNAAVTPVMAGHDDPVEHPHAGPSRTSAAGGTTEAGHG